MEGSTTSPRVPIRIYPPRRRRNAIVDLLNASLHEFENIELFMNARDRGAGMNSEINTESGHPATCEHFINTLEEISVTEEMVSQGLECSICLEAFEENEKCVQLPCTDHPHYFHYGHEGEACSGVKPWLQRNNTCPVCRTEFPGQRAATLRQAVPQQQGILEERNIQIPASLIPTNNTDLTPEQIEGLIQPNQVPAAHQRWVPAPGTEGIPMDNNYNEMMRTHVDFIQDNIVNTIMNNMVGLRPIQIRNEEADMQRAIELSLAN